MYLKTGAYEFILKPKPYFVRILKAKPYFDRFILKP